MQQLLCSWIEQRKSRAHSTLTAVASESRMSYQIIKKKTGTSSCSLYSSINMLDYSTRNHKFKRLKPHLQLSATRSASRRARKLLSICHNHGSAPRSPYMPCQIMVQRKSSELEQNYRMVPVVDLTARSAIKMILLWAMQHRCQEGEKALG